MYVPKLINNTHTHTHTHTYIHLRTIRELQFVHYLSESNNSNIHHTRSQAQEHAYMPKPAPPVHTSLTILHLVPINFQTPQMTCAATAASYEELCTKLRKISHLEGAMGLMGWDEQTMMPIGAEE